MNPRAFLQTGLAWLYVVTAWQAVLTAAGAQGMRREVLPVPPVFVKGFRECGLKVFDPFDVHSFERQQNARPPVPVPAAATPPPLTGSAFYDLLPLYARRGFQPAAGTVALYEPESRHVYLKATEMDMKVLRGFCTWPLENWKDLSSISEITLSLALWGVPVAGAGTWKFTPRTPADLLALPAQSRRIIDRQTLNIRGGQRSKITSITRPVPDDEHIVDTGMVTEAEVTVSEDRSMIELNLAVEACPAVSRAGTGYSVSCIFQRHVRSGEPFLVEMCGLPGRNMERIFLICQADLRDRHPRGNIKRWTEGEKEGETVFRTWEIPGVNKQLPLPPGADHEVEASVKDLLFGNMPVRRVNDRAEKVLGVKFTAGTEFYYCGDPPVVFFRGAPAGAAAFDRYYRETIAESSWGDAVMEVYALLTKSPATAEPDDGEAEILTRTLIHVRSGQVSGSRLNALPHGQPNKELGPALNLILGASRDNPDPPVPPQWRAGVEVTAGPPLVPAEVTTGNKNAQNALPLRQAVGVPQMDGR